MKRSKYDINNSMEQEEQEEEEESLELNDRSKAMQEVNNTMLSENKEKQLKKIKNRKKEKNNILDEIDDELEENNNIDIQNIFEINTKFNYSKDFPLFYLKDELNSNRADEIYKEPISSNKLKDLIKSKKIKPYLIQIKLVDIFYMKNHSQFSFIPLNEILEKNWTNNLSYSNIFINAHNKLNEKENKEINDNNNSNKKKIEILPKKQKIKPKPKNIKNDDISLNFNCSVVNQGGFNDLSMSIIKQLEGVNLTKKQVDKIASIIEEVEEDEWTEIKNKKNGKEFEEKIEEGIVGLNDNKKVSTKNKKNVQPKKKKNNFKDNNQFNGLKIDYYD